DLVIPDIFWLVAIEGVVEPVRRGLDRPHDDSDKQQRVEQQEARRRRPTGNHTSQPAERRAGQAIGAPDPETTENDRPPPAQVVQKVADDRATLADAGYCRKNPEEDDSETDDRGKPASLAR